MFEAYISAATVPHLRSTLAILDAPTNPSTHALEVSHRQRDAVSAVRLVLSAWSGVRQEGIVSFVASSLARVPRHGFDWYVFFVEDSFDDELRRQLRDNFEPLGKAVGPQALVVKGFDADRFALEWGPLGVDPPALVVADHVPVYGEEVKGRRIELGLNAEFIRSVSIIKLLKQLVTALNDPDAMEALERLDSAPGRVKKFWGWVAEYADIKPNFMGFGINGNAIISRLVA